MAKGPGARGAVVFVCHYCGNQQPGRDAADLDRVQCEVCGEPVAEVLTGGG